ncbi:MAG: aminotransferase class I/II-fold pyridoxal phosphate-dependent enzyme [Clostridium sp.]|nr:aminotransferase class I/II-fold pyridoxal phosphate-dependent enzyme [Clostridium sp.]
MKKRLFDNLEEYSKSDFYPFHMPGHKRSSQSGPLAGVYKYDITEIDGFDNLHQPSAVIKDIQEYAAKLYHSEETYFLVNGSTAGILSAVSAVAERGKKLIISRNCHKAVYHAAFLNRMELYYVYPEQVQGYHIAGPVAENSLRKVIEGILKKESSGEEAARELIAGIVITSPTYEGITSDVRKITDLAHEYGIPLIVDQAHGAHFGMHPDYPQSAVEEGADIVIHSVHKTLPAPTQTALIHRNGKWTDGEALRKYLRIYQSSSPSYLLMAGIDEAMHLAAEEGYQRLSRLLFMRNSFLKKIEKCRYIRVCPLTEPGKLVISVTDFMMTGQELYDILRERYHLQMEMASGNCVVAILTMMDEEAGFDRLSGALVEIDGELGAIKKEADKKLKVGQEAQLSFKSKEEGETSFGKSFLYGLDLKPSAALNLWEAYRMACEEVELEEAEGKISAEFVNLYPPGIPLLAPGEIISRKIIRAVRENIKIGYKIQGICDEKIKVLKSS